MSLFPPWKLWLRYRVLKHLLLNRPGHTVSCSQTGEDMIIRAAIDAVDRGFYVDIGAFHPIGFSNTYHFYFRGWRGLNVDATPGSMRLFRLLRPRDINVEACVDVVPGVERDFHMFELPALNTITAAGLRAGIETHGAKLLRTVRLVTTTVNELLAAHVPRGQPIHFMTFDVEGMDEKLIAGLDFDTYRPWVLCFEDKAADVAAQLDSTTVRLLRAKGYAVVGATPLSVIMKRMDV
jgi:hypothetical protein